MTEPRNHPEDQYPWEDPYQEGRQPDAWQDQRERERLRLQEEDRRLAIARRNEIVTRAIEIVYYLVGALLILLLIRFFLRLSGANPENQFASIIYNFSEPFAAPFSTLFISPTFGQSSIFDLNLLVGMAVYALLALLVARFIRLIWGVED